MSSSKPLNVAIVGSGLAGLAAACYLRRKHKVTVYERGSASVSTGGQGIMIAPNGARFLDQLGWQADRAGGVPIYGLRSYDKGGREMKEDVPLDLKARFGNDYTALKRSQFREELLRLATEPASTEKGEPASMIFEANVTDLDASAGILTLASGDEVHADVVIDGIHSRLRNAVLGNNSHVPRKTGLTCYRIAVSEEDVHASLGETKAPHWWDPSTSPNRTSIISAGDGTSRVVVAYPIANNKMFNLSCILKTPESQSGTAESWYVDADRDEMVRLFGDLDEGLKKVLLAAREIKVWELQDLEPLPTWTKGRAMLIGDCAHAMTPLQGQGANMAVEDAESLSLLLDPDVTRSDVPDLLQKAADVRRPRLEQVLEATRRVHSTKGVVENMIANLEFNCSYEGVKAALRA